MNTTPYGYKPPDSFTPGEVAQMLGVKPSTVYAWLSRKELRGSKYGTRRFITLEQLREFYQTRNTGEFTNYVYSPRNEEVIC